MVLFIFSSTYHTEYFLVPTFTVNLNILKQVKHEYNNILNSIFFIEVREV